MTSLPRAQSFAAPPRLLITAGPTHEPIDAVRFVSNRSSGRLGAAVAASAAERGWRVTALFGPVAPPPLPTSVKLLRFQTAADLQALLRQEWPGHDALVMAAAVADHRPVLPPKTLLAEGGKLRRRDGALTITLEPTPDLLAELAELTRPDQVAVGFALEPRERLLASAADKLRRKKLAAIVANPLETMGAATVEGMLLTRDGRQLAPSSPGPIAKELFADWLVDRVAELLRAVGASVDGPGGASPPASGSAGGADPSTAPASARDSVSGPASASRTARGRSTAAAPATRIDPP